MPAQNTVGGSELTAAPLRVLSIDGGGVRGLIPAMLLQELERRAERPLSEVFDVFVGTSTGGLIALGLTVRGPGGDCASADELVRLYDERASEIFGRRHGDLVTVGGGPTAGAAEWVKRFRRRFRIDPPHARGNARYDTESLERVLDGVFGSAMLSSAIRPVVVTSYDMHTSQPVLFRSDDAASDRDKDVLAKLVAMATSAAPTYFPPVAIPGRSGVYVDGGLTANNPSIVALVEGLIRAGSDRPVLLVSAGTGGSSRAEASVGQVGALPWPMVALRVIESLFDGSSDLADELLGTLAHRLENSVTYFRFQQSLGEVSAAMDDASSSHIAELRAVGRLLVEDASDDLDRVVRIALQTAP
jgi:predicted acylesterase/phospholipase RssA